MDELIAAGFTVAEIAASHNLTHAKVRQSLTAPPSRLCKDTVEEVRRTRIGDGTSVVNLAREYKCTKTEMLTALYHDRREEHKLTDSALITLWIQERTEPAQLARHFQVAVSLILSRLYALGLLQRPESLKKLVLDLLDEGMDAHDVSSRLGCPLATVYSYKSQANITKRQHGRLPPETWVKLLDEYDNGVDVTSLAQRYGISRAAIYRRI